MRLFKALFLSIICFLVIIISSVYVYADGFYQDKQRYKGFYWFEDSIKKEKNKKNIEFKTPTAQEASDAIAERKKDLDDARNQMVELGFREDVPVEVLRRSIIKYKKLEAKMYDGALRLVYANEMANFTNPEIANVAELPTNVFANKIKRKSDEEERVLIIREFAKEFNLLIFTDNNCPYSRAFEPVIMNFVSKYGFNLDRASLNSKEGKIAQTLGITGTPTLVAISKDAKEMFEISRSMISASELEANIVLSHKYSREQKAAKLKIHNQNQARR